MIMSLDIKACKCMKVEIKRLNKEELVGGGVQREIMFIAQVWYSLCPIIHCFSPWLLLYRIGNTYEHNKILSNKKLSWKGKCFRKRCGEMLFPVYILKAIYKSCHEQFWWSKHIFADMLRFVNLSFRFKCSRWLMFKFRDVYMKFLRLFCFSIFLILRTFTTLHSYY